MVQYDQVIVSDGNRTPIVQIVTWFTLVTSLLAFFTHASIKFYVFRALTTESWLVLLSLVFCIAQSIAVTMQAEYGYGKPMLDLSEQDVTSNLKSDYAATILFIISLGFSKLAVLAFVHHLTPSELHRKINWGVTALASLWLFCSVWVAAFECRVPHPWDRRHGRCNDRLTWWNAVSILNIVTELAIVTLELGITAQLHVTRQRKASVMGIFSCRLLVLAAAVVQLAFFNHESKNVALRDDLTLGYWRSTICNQIVQCLAIVTTCLPYTKLFMEGFESGLLRLDDSRRRGEHSSKSASRSYQLMEISRSGRSGPSRGIQVSKSWAVQTEPVTTASSSSQTSQSRTVP